MKAVVFTLGCKVNECESESLVSGLKARGYKVFDKLVKADLYIVNTCAVTAEAEKKSRQTASRIKRLNPHAKIIFTGCAAEKNYKAFADKSAAYLVTGVFNKNAILDALDKSGVMIAEKSEKYEELPAPTSLRTRAFIKVQDGCDSFCTYCIIPHLRGRSRSRSPQSVVNEITALNPAEAIVTGINLSDYRYGDIDLTGLIERLNAVNSRIRLGSLEVRVIDDGFLTALKNLKDFAPHFHLSLQSGSDAVLKKMNRKYTRGEFIEKVGLIRRYFPLAGITTDIIAGFPTETEEDFNETLSLIDTVKFSDIHPFIFSPRSGTPAYRMPDLPFEVKKSRLDRLLEIKRRLKAEFAAAMLGKTAEFLPEEFKDGFTEGYSENYLRLYVKGEIPIGKILKVKIGEPFRDGAKAEIIND
ncbi:MAG: tRNA (N(6)-L-threonylcarbamoyladenosine(37)-C(2))-methylthiotransferase MtaB [Clostridia bacterium]|nr:tRNA (N(6)-L-threonylcarbamoyladenosine(37)-C(2))-methylthiotransferase MtaB [Clostridia bacterium]